MKTDVENMRIGILPGMADLYNRLSPGLRDRLTQFFKREIENLKTDGLEFVLNDVVCTREEADAGCARLIERDVDLIVPALAPYCPSGVLAPAFLQLDTPLLLWPAQGIFELKPDLYDSAAIIMNHGVHGVQDLANVLRRKGKVFGVIHGHWRQDSFRRELFSWAQAARAIRSMRKSNPVQIGGHFKDMLDLQIGSDEFIEKLGVTHKAISLKDFIDVLEKIEDRQLDKRTAFYRTLFEIGAGVNDSLIGKAARGELAVRRIMKKHNSCACGLNFLKLCNHELISDPLHVAGSILMGEGFGYAGEGDWVTAAFVYAMQQAFGTASFSEIFSVDYANNRLVLKHWGEGNIEMARKKPRLLRSDFTDVNSMEFAMVDFEFSPGRATLANLNSNPHGQGQLISITGFISEDTLPKATGPRAVFEPDREDVRDLLTDYAYNGGSHHLVLVKGEGKSVLERMAKLAGWQYVSLSGGTCGDFGG